MTFYNKDMIYAEFKEAEIKDNKNKKNKYGNRIKFFKDHIELRKNHPEYYDGLDIHFDNLLEAWSAPNPRDHFYKKIFGRTYQEQMDHEAAQDGKEEELNERNSGNPKPIKIG